MLRADTGAPSPYLLAVGCPRSGTTLLQRMLDAHPLLAVANDTHFIARTVQAAAGGSPEIARSSGSAAALIAWARGYHRFPRLGLTDQAVDRAAAESSTFVDFVAALYRELARSQGKVHGGEKTPDYVRRLPLLHELFPGIRSLHIVRDGRDVALSTLEWARESKGPGRFPLWREEPVAVCALWWAWQVGSGRRAAPSLAKGAVLEVRYEELVAEPEAEVARICEFLGLPFAREMLEFNRGRERSDPRLSAKKAWRGPTPGLRDWRSQMNRRALELFEALAGDLLEELGYARMTGAPSAAVADAAARCRERWEKEAPGRTSGEPSLAVSGAGR